VAKLEELNRRYKDQGLVLVGIYRGVGTSEGSKQIAAQKINWVVGFDSQNETFNSYFPPDGGFVTGSAYYAFVDRAGKRRDTDANGASLEADLKRLLAEAN